MFQHYSARLLLKYSLTVPVTMFSYVTNPQVWWQELELIRYYQAIKLVFSLSQV